MNNHLGIIGLATMGANLAQNLADHKFKVAVFNRTASRTEDLIKSYGPNKGLEPFYDLKKFIDGLSDPKIILLMIQAGEAVDVMLEQLRPLLKKGDIVIDGGNAFFKDTIRREAALKELGIYFIGMGVSGGEEGARHGPSIMVGGEKIAWNKIKSIFEKIAAKDFKNLPCIDLIGENGAGHFVKMVHNAIEYVDMELIAEIYWLMKNGLLLRNEEMAKIFEKWNKGKLNSYLIEITAKILKTRDKNNKYVIDYILDAAGNKGTGKWAALESLDIGAPSFNISMAVFARYISAFKKERQILAKKYKKSKCKLNINISQLEKALYASKILAYAQGYELIQLAGEKYNWHINLKELSRIWQGGCIIRAKFLNNLYQVFKNSPACRNILLTEHFGREINENIKHLRAVAMESIRGGLPVSAILSSISYFDSATSEKISANLIQAQRDFFGAHGFQIKIDGELLHHNWSDNV